MEVHHDEKGIIWPKQVSPFSAHLLVVSDESGVISQAEDIYKKLTKAGIDILFDDRKDVSAGEKFADCDLIGIPTRLVVSKKVGKGKVEVKRRGEEKIEIDSVSKTESLLTVLN